jgi:hypothetical protein
MKDKNFVDGLSTHPMEDKMRPRIYDTYTYKFDATEFEYGWTIQVTSPNEDLTYWIVTRQRHGHDVEKIGIFETPSNPPQYYITQQVQRMILMYGIEIMEQRHKIKLKASNQYL